MIHILTTGGTIEGLDYVDDSGITKSNVTIKDFLKIANVDFNYTIESVFKKDSRAINENDIKRFGWVIHIRFICRHRCTF